MVSYTIHPAIQNCYNSFLSSLLGGDRVACAQIVQNLLDRDVPIADIYEELVQRSMYDVGAMWAANEVSVATEHMATAIIEGLLPLVYPRIFAVEPNGRRAIVSCVANEHHQIGGKMIADLMSLDGWDTFFLGASSPLPDLLQSLEEIKPHVLGLSLSVYFNLPSLLDAIPAIREQNPDLPIAVGGQAFAHGGQQAVEEFENVKVLADMTQLKQWLEKQL